MVFLIATKTQLDSCCEIEIWFMHGMLWLENKRLFIHVLQHICCRSYRREARTAPVQTSAVGDEDGELQISVLLSVSDILTNIRGGDKEMGVIPNKPA